MAHARFSVEDGRRIGRATRKVERMIPSQTGRPRRYPVASSSPPVVLFRVHEGRDDDGLFEEWKTITRSLYPEGFIARRATVQFNDDRSREFNTADSDVTVYCDLLENVLFTDGYFYAANYGGEFFALSGGQSFWSEAITTENSTAGMVDVELFRADGGIDGGYTGITEGPIVTAMTDFSIADRTSCYVTFDSRRQEFIVTDQLCPAAP